MQCSRRRSCGCVMTLRPWLHLKWIGSTLIRPCVSGLFPNAWQITQKRMTMKRTKEKKTRALRVLMAPSEYEELKKKWRGTSHRVFSDYIRDMLPGKPMVKWYRSRSLDEILEVLVGIKNRLE